MSFINQTELPADPSMPISRLKKSFWKKRGTKITLGIIGTILLVAVAYGSYLFATGSKIFENGITAKTLFQTIANKPAVLKGQTEDRINILLLGMGGNNHPGGYLTDTIMLISIEPNEKKAALISIPRDLLVPIKGHGDDKINAAFADAYNDYVAKNCPKQNSSNCLDSAMTNGANSSVTTVSNILNINIQYYVVANFTGFEKIIDTLGGIDVTVDKAINDPSYPDANMIDFSPFKISAGPHHLDGATALKYARSRETTSDFDRAARQQKVLIATKDKALQIGILTNPKKIADLVATLSSSIRTNFTIAELKTLLNMSKDFSSGNVTTKVFASGPSGELNDATINGTFYLQTKTGNFKQLQLITADIFNQSTENEAAKIEVLNGTATAGVASVLAKDLQENYSYTITNIATSTQKLDKTLIYDYTAGKKPNTLNFLKKKLGSVDVVVKASPVGQTADFTIIIGKSYKP